MGFNWSLDGPDDSVGAEANEPSPSVPNPFAQLGFLPVESVGVEQSSVVAQSVVPAPVAPVMPSRRELRMAALAKPQPTPLNQTALPSTALSNDVVHAPAIQPRPLLAESQAPVLRRQTSSASSASAAGKPLGRRILPRVLSAGAMLGAAALFVATSLPANALMTSNADAVTTTSSHVQAQSLAAVNASAVAQTSARDKYTVISRAEQMNLRFVSSNWAYTNDPNGTIQWPFPVQVPISTGFGPRQVAGCSFCSTFHLGVDFDPGQGVAIGAIADGVVSDVVNSHAGLGNHVVIDHVINGQKVQSVYAHMLDGSIRVAIGDHVTVGQEVGQVGSTGESTGAHLHLEIHVNGVPIDPFAWLKANAN